jgi:hypothetical protein
MAEDRGWRIEDGGWRMERSRIAGSSWSRISWARGSRGSSCSFADTMNWICRLVLARALSLAVVVVACDVDRARVSTAGDSACDRDSMHVDDTARDGFVTGPGDSALSTDTGHVPYAFRRLETIEELRAGDLDSSYAIRDGATGERLLLELREDMFILRRGQRVLDTLASIDYRGDLRSQQLPAFHPPSSILHPRSSSILHPRSSILAPILPCPGPLATVPFADSAATLVRPRRPAQSVHAEACVDS